MHLSDNQLLEMLLSSDDDEVNKGLRLVYVDYFPLVNSLVTSNSGTSENAADVFQEAVIVLVRQLRHGKFEGRSSIKGFLYGIARNIWLNELRKSSVQTVSLEEVDYTLTDEAVMENSLDRKYKIGTFVNQLDQKCKSLLRAFYYHKKSIKEIMRIFGIDTEAAVKNRKYRCMKKLISLVNQQNLSRSSFEDT